MNSFRKNLAAAMSASLVLAGVALLFSAVRPQVLSVDQTRQVTGGTINGVKLIYANCPGPSAACTTIECDENDECPAGTAEQYQIAQTYPYGTAAGSDWATTVPANYQCNQYRACSNPCSQSTIDNLWYCGGAVGPTFNSPPVQGAQGGQPFQQEA